MRLNRISVLLLWGLFDNELHIEFEGEWIGSYYPVSGPILLNRYRAFRKGAISQWAERIRTLAQQLSLPIAALTGENIALISQSETYDIPRQSLPAATENATPVPLWPNWRSPTSWPHRWQS